MNPGPSPHSLAALQSVDDFLACDRSQGIRNLDGDTVTDEIDCAIGKEDVYPAVVLAAWRHCHTAPLRMPQ